MNAVVVPEPHIERRMGKVVVTLDNDEANTVLGWLDSVNTSKLNDQQYLYFIKFKRQLHVMANVVSANVTIEPLPVADD